MERALPDTLEGYGARLRRLEPGDAEALGRAVIESIEHLRPWMAWIAEEPVTSFQRRAMLEQWRRGWPQTGEAVYGVFAEQALAGVCGMRPRTPRTIELGYWVHHGFVRRGLATSASRLLTDLAFTWPDLDAVEIHHDKANLASGGVPRALGYRLIGETPDPKLAPADTGIDCTWRVERADWR
jgi:RimJ/RimL family protein N-acetyltransferase